MATFAVFTMIPIWNDLWFPLILAPAEAPRPSPSLAIFIGQFVTNWKRVLSALAGDLPVLSLRHLSRQPDPRHHGRSSQVESSAPPIRVLSAGLRQYGPRTSARLSSEPRLRNRRRCQPIEGGVAEALQDTRSWPSFPEGAGRAEPELCSINTYSDTHADYAVMADGGGSHVFVEKPLATTVATAERVGRLARANGRKLGRRLYPAAPPVLDAADRGSPQARRPFVFRNEPEPAVERPDLDDAQGR